MHEKPLDFPLRPAQPDQVQLGGIYGRVIKPHVHLGAL